MTTPPVEILSIAEYLLATAHEIVQPPVVDGARETATVLRLAAREYDNGRPSDLATAVLAMSTALTGTKSLTPEQSAARRRGVDITPYLAGFTPDEASR